MTDGSFSTGGVGWRVKRPDDVGSGFAQVFFLKNAPGSLPCPGTAGAVPTPAGSATQVRREACPGQVRDVRVQDEAYGPRPRLQGHAKQLADGQKRDEVRGGKDGRAKLSPLQKRKKRSLGKKYVVKGIPCFRSAPPPRAVPRSLPGPACSAPPPRAADLV